MGLALSACSQASQRPAAPAAAEVDEATNTRAWSLLSNGLVGNWEAHVERGVVKVGYRLISNGSALLETFVTPSGKETASVYHRAGNRVIVTHYCGQGNQPRLRVVSADEASVRLEFLDATDVDPNEGVMRSLLIELRPGGFDQTAAYRTGDGKDEPETLHFKRAP